LERYKAAFVAVRQDPQWKRKVVYAALITLIPYLGLVWVWGWQMQYQRSVAWGSDRHLPEWSDFGRQAVLGLSAYVAILPYSLALSVVIMPVLVIVPTLALVTGGPTQVPGWLYPSVALGTFLVVLAGSMLIFPLTASVTVRIALHGTLESGFQVKEIWRLMRQSKDELLRVWGYTTLNMAVSMGVMILLMGSVATGIVLAVGSSVGGLAIPLLVLGRPLAYCVSVGLSAYLGIVNSHYLGSYGRVAYGLGEPPAETAPV